MAYQALNPSPDPALALAKLQEEQQNQMPEQVTPEQVKLGNINYGDLYNLGSGPTMCSLGQCADIPAMWQRVRQTGDYSHAPVLESNVQTAARNWAKAMLNKDNAAGLASAEKMSRYLNLNSGATNDEANKLMQQIPGLDYNSAINKAAAINAQNAGQFGDANFFGATANPGFKRAVAGTITNNLAYGQPSPAYIDPQTGAFINPYSYSVNDNGSFTAKDNITGRTFTTRGDEALVSNLAYQSNNPYETMYSKMKESREDISKYEPKYLDSQANLIRTRASLLPKGVNMNGNITAQGIPELNQVQNADPKLVAYQQGLLGQLQQGKANVSTQGNSVLHQLAAQAVDPTPEELQQGLAIGAKNDQIYRSGGNKFYKLPASLSEQNLKALWARSLVRRGITDPYYLGLYQTESNYKPWITNKTPGSTAGGIAQLTNARLKDMANESGIKYNPSLKYNPLLVNELMANSIAKRQAQGWSPQQYAKYHYGSKNPNKNIQYANLVGINSRKALNGAIQNRSNVSSPKKSVLFSGANYY